MSDLDTDGLDSTYRSGDTTSDEFLSLWNPQISHLWNVDKNNYIINVKYSW